MILYSVWPVLQNSTATLIHLLPARLTKKKQKIENKVKYPNIDNKFKCLNS
jgi:hypothetical protein